MSAQIISVNGQASLRGDDGAEGYSSAPSPAHCVPAALSAPRLLLTAAEAAAACRTSVRTWRSWDGAGKIPAAVQLGRVKLWRPLELADWVSAGCPPRAQWEWEPRV